MYNQIPGYTEAPDQFAQRNIYVTSSPYATKGAKPQTQPQNLFPLAPQQSANQCLRVVPPIVGTAKDWGLKNDDVAPWYHTETVLVPNTGIPLANFPVRAAFQMMFKDKLQTGPSMRGIPTPQQRIKRISPEFLRMLQQNKNSNDVYRQSIRGRPKSNRRVKCEAVCVTTSIEQSTQTLACPNDSAKDPETPAAPTEKPAKNSPSPKQSNSIKMVTVTLSCENNGPKDQESRAVSPGKPLKERPKQPTSTKMVTSYTQVTPLVSDADEYLNEMCNVKVCRDFRPPLRQKAIQEISRNPPPSPVGGKEAKVDPQVDDDEDWFNERPKFRSSKRYLRHNRSRGGKSEPAETPPSGNSSANVQVKQIDSTTEIRTIRRRRRSGMETKESVSSYDDRGYGGKRYVQNQEEESPKSKKQSWWHLRDNKGNSLNKCKNDCMKRKRKETGDDYPDDYTAYSNVRAHGFDKFQVYDPERYEKPEKTPVRPPRRQRSSEVYAYDEDDYKGSVRSRHSRHSKHSRPSSPCRSDKDSDSSDCTCMSPSQSPSHSAKPRPGVEPAYEAENKQLTSISYIKAHGYDKVRVVEVEAVDGRRRRRKREKQEAAKRRKIVHPPRKKFSTITCLRSHGFERLPLADEEQFSAQKKKDKEEKMEQEKREKERKKQEEKKEWLKNFWGQEEERSDYSMAEPKESRSREYKPAERSGYTEVTSMQAHGFYGIVVQEEEPRKKAKKPKKVQKEKKSKKSCGCMVENCHCNDDGGGYTEITSVKAHGYRRFVVSDPEDDTMKATAEPSQHRKRDSLKEERSYEDYTTDDRRSEQPNSPPEQEEIEDYPTELKPCLCSVSRHSNSYAQGNYTADKPQTTNAYTQKNYTPEEMDTMPETEEEPKRTQRHENTASQSRRNHRSANSSHYPASGLKKCDCSKSTKRYQDSMDWRGVSDNYPSRYKEAARLAQINDMIAERHRQKTLAILKQAKKKQCVCQQKGNETISRPKLSSPTRSEPSSQRNCRNYETRGKSEPRRSSGQASTPRDRDDYAERTQVNDGESPSRRRSPQMRCRFASRCPSTHSSNTTMSLGTSDGNETESGTSVESRRNSRKRYEENDYEENRRSSKSRPGGPTIPPSCVGKYKHIPKPVPPEPEWRYEATEREMSKVDPDWPSSDDENYATKRKRYYDCYKPPPGQAPKCPAVKSEQRKCKCSSRSSGGQKGSCPSNCRTRAMQYAYKRPSNTSIASSNCETTKAPKSPAQQTETKKCPCQPKGEYILGVTTQNEVPRYSRKYYM